MTTTNLRRLEPIRIYVGLICAVGASVVLASAMQLRTSPHPVDWSLFAVMALIAGRMLIKFPGVDAHISVSDTFFIASSVLFGPAPATVAIAVDSLVIGWRRGWRTRQILFNGASIPLSLWLGAQVFFAMTGTGPLFGQTITADLVVLPLACFASVYFILNSGLTACAVAIEKHITPMAIWRKHFGIVALSYFAAASATFFLLLVVQYFSLTAVAAVLPLFAIFHFAMKSWTGRLADADQHVAALDRLYLSTIGALSTAIEAKDGVTSMHIHRVQHYAMGLARALGPLDELTMKAIQAAALLHDTGKLAVPERILNKPGKLTPAEFETMKLHVEVGADILSSIDFPYPVVPIVRAHHENWDGSGYPNGLKGVEIPIGARILSVVDCYDALTSDRPYRAAMSDVEALAIIRERRGTMYDPAVVDTFEVVARDMAPLTVKPQLQKAIQHITRAAAAVAVVDMPAPRVAVVAPVVAPVSDGPEGLHALVNLARVVSGKPTTADISSLMWSHVRHVVPSASCAFFVSDAATDNVKAAFVAGTAADILQGLEMKIGDRLTGWVAANHQPIINSEAKLDLGAEAELAALKYCASFPLVAGDQLAGVLSLYAAEQFRDDQAATLQFVVPHLAQMFASIDKRAAEAAPAAAKQPLRIISSR